MKNRFTDGFEIKLLKYSLAAGAVLLGAKEADAQVWYSGNVNSTIGGHGSISITFNGNARFTINDNVVTTLRTPSGTPSGTPGISYTVRYYNGSIRASTTNAKWIPVSGKVNAKALPGSYAVSHSKVFQNNGVTYKPLSNASFENSTKYIGVKFDISGQIHYGWIKLTMSSNANQITIDSYAYEESAGNPIKTGQTVDVSLAVQMSSFTAENANDEVKLKWSTASEVNLAGFVVERSAVSNQLSAANWVKIGYVKSAGTNTSTTDYSFTDTNPVSGKVEYRLKEMNTDGTYKYTTPVTIDAVPTKFELSQNYPNPFNPTTKISYALPKAGHVTLRVYNSVGEVVSTLVDEEKQPGEYTATFNGAGLASGVYFYEMNAGEFRQVMKLMLLK